MNVEIDARLLPLASTTVTGAEKKVGAALTMTVGKSRKQQQSLRKVTRMLNW